MLLHLLQVQFGENLRGEHGGLGMQELHQC
jgi:hypothetical protein